VTRRAQAVVLIVLVGAVAGGALLLSRAPRPDSAPAEMEVFAPCGMTGPLNAAIRLFRQANPETRLGVVYDNAIVLVRKIRAGARPDVFISPGEMEMGQMVTEGYVDQPTVRDFGSLDLVVIAPKRMKELRTADDLKRPEVKTISLADPQQNSVGYYGEQALRSLGLWEPLQSKLLLREYPLEAVSLVTTGRVDAGLTYLSCPLETAPEKADKSEVRIVARIPREAYPKVRLQLGMLRESANQEAAQRFIDFMVSREAQEALAANGLLPLEEEK
jgi:molybdate transport system substrate-binding protein